MPKAKFARPGKKKPKSIKTKAKLSAKRKLSRFGKEQKKGYSGVATTFMTRTRAIKKLQITLRDFRRLCILKGIYPRDPKKKASGQQHSYYHIKDIQYLSHEPLLQKFREFKTFMKKVRRAAGRQDLKEARRIHSNKPEYTLDHLLKERYPRFTDAVGDLDDCLCMVHLFASLPAQGRIQSARTNMCLRLCREWQNYVVQARCLKKTFISIKGIYYQAEVRGMPVTWVVPHQFSQEMPNDVDYRIMLTFLEFHEAMMQFVLFKLYHDLGLTYPPPLRDDMDSAGAHLATVDMEAAARKAVAGPSDDEDEEGSGEGGVDEVAASRIQSLTSKIKNMQKDSDEEASDKEEGSDDESSDESSDEELGLVEGADEQEILEAKARREAAKQQKRFAKLFKGLVFFLSREVPRETMEFVIKSFGGEVGWQGPGAAFDESDPAITHHVTDRPNFKGKYEGREYIQPQWVFDSVNAQLCLPVHKYSPSASLPPHLSPFVEDTREGYIPAYRTELDKLRAAAGLSTAIAVDGGDDEGEEDNGERIGDLDEESDSEEEDEDESKGDDDEDEDDDSEEESDEDDSEEEEEAAPAPAPAPAAGSGKRRRRRGVKRAREDDEPAGETPEEQPRPAKLSKAARRKAAADAAADQKRELQEMMLSKKSRRMYNSVMRAKKRQSDHVENLRSKRKSIEASKDASVKTKSGKKQKKKGKK